eukprot:211321-Chlamydomonas_euryale.AAC.1
MPCSSWGGLRGRGFGGVDPGRREAPWLCDGYQGRVFLGFRAVARPLLLGWCLVVAGVGGGAAGPAVGSLEWAGSVLASLGWAFRPAGG